jgi:phage shock protein PspC (stress-responsive transcriptional regulator)
MIATPKKEAPRMATTRTCPYCAEEIATEAIRCRYCRSRLTTLDPEQWYRNHPERRLAGVATAVARAFAIPVNIVRVGFLALTFFHFLGPIVYGGLWLAVPYAAGEDSLLERWLAAARALLVQLRSGAGCGHGPRRGADPARGGENAAAVSSIPGGHA